MVDAGRKFETLRTATASFFEQGRLTLGLSHTRALTEQEQRRHTSTTAGKRNTLGTVLSPGAVAYG